MRFPLLAALPVLLLLAWVARAEEDPLPPYGASDLGIEEESLPEGWTVVYEQVPDTPGEALEARVSALATTEGVDEGDLLFETRVLKSPAGPHATVLLVEVDGEAKGLLARLEKVGQTEGWKVRAMGHPSRILVVAAPPDLQTLLLDLQVDVAVETLTRLAYERHESGSRIGAAGYANGALAIAPKAGKPHAVLGLAATKDEEWDEAISEFAQAFAKGASHPPTDRLAHWAWRSYAYALLQKKDKESDAKAAEALEKAIETEKFAESQEPLFPIHYNLACALARLGRTQDACARLEDALQMAKARMGPEGFRAYLQNHVLKDEDLEELRKSSCFQEVVDRVTGGEGTSPLDGI